MRQGVNNGIKKFTHISNGASHTCAIASGKAYCWGRGGSGQLGNNSSVDQPTPVAVLDSGVLAGKTVTEISAGYVHTCAIADGRAYCWGQGSSGQIGDGFTSQRNVPVAVRANPGDALYGKVVTSIVAGARYTCAIADGRAYCWGDNRTGQLGDGSNSTRTLPVAVDTSGDLSGRTVTSIDASTDAFEPYSHTCAIAGGAAYCWGDGGGKLGNGSPDASNIPVAVDTSGVLAGKTVTEISAGQYHTCSVADNDAYCWGYGLAGQLGQGSATSSGVPVAVDTSGVLAGKAVTSISAGSSYTCATADGAAYCWGTGTQGRLGRGSTVGSATPVAVDASGVLSGKFVTSISASEGDGYMPEAHTCAIAGGGVYCWGLGSGGRLGNGSTASTQALVPVSITGPLAFRGAAMNAGDNEFILQYAQLSNTECSLQTTGFAAVTNTTPVSYSTNTGVANGAAISSTPDDPVEPDSGVPQTYRSATGSFTNTTDIPPGKTGLWDFSLKDNGAEAGETYCLRIAYDDGSPIENASAYAEITIAEGVLLIEIVSASDTVVPSPSFGMPGTTVRTSCQTVNGTFGTSTQRIRVFNSLSATGWSVNTSATDGPTATWSSGSSSYDFNDPSGSPPGCNSGSDGDGIAGRMTLDPLVSNITPQSGCSTTGLSKGNLAGFSQGVTDSITLLAASTSAPMNCYFYITGIGVTQQIPANQPAGSYSIQLTTTVVAQ